MVPAALASSGGYSGLLIFGFCRDPYVLTGRGVLKGLTADSSMKDLLGKLGIDFQRNAPMPTQVKYGFAGAAVRMSREATSYQRGQSAEAACVYSASSTRRYARAS